MLGWLSESKKLTVEFCDRCARVCNSACRAAALREETLAKALRFGMRV